ncbi:hypothetical protein JVU11DRAFT_9146 [Chiua virens]|nr:hypothetical protein JVU11DRAFT_9146 [Chiua virens]
MAEFLWQFDHLSAVERGHDPTVQPAEIVPDLAVRVRQKLGIKSNDMALYRYELPGMSGLGYAYSPKPSTQNRLPVCRRTRSLPVVWVPAQDNIVKEGPWHQEQIIYMKDIKVMPEHEIYKILHSHGTPNIPEHVAGGKTRTQEFGNAPWLCVKLRISPYQHCRLFRGVVGRALYKFVCTKELVTGVFDALQAHSHAFEKAKILHRDISAGNIILTDEGRGLLIDWELGKLVDDVGSRRPDRAGTWQFMSANLLKNLGKMHEFADDLESFLHVLAWITLRYVPAGDTYSAGNRDYDLAMFDEVCSNLGHFESGGRAKAKDFAAGTYPSEDFAPRISTPLLKLLAILRKPFKSFYGQPPSDEDRKKIDIPREQQDDKLIALRVIISEYDEDIESLKMARSFLDEMRCALDKEAWPMDDKAGDNLPGSFTTTKKIRVKTTQRGTNHLANSKGSSSRGSKRRCTPAASEAHA